MRLLLVLLEPPLPDGHASARWFDVLLRELTERGHAVTAFASCSSADAAERARARFAPPRYDLRCYPHPARGGLRAKWETLRRPYAYAFSAEMLADIRRETERGFDLLHLEQTWSGWVARQLGLESRSVLHVHHLTSVDLAGERSLRVEFMNSAERTMIRRLGKRGAGIRVLSPELATEVRRIEPAAHPVVIPFAFDLASTPYLPESERHLDPPTVFLTGSMRWAPNRLAALRLALRLWPAIRVKVPGARLRIAGWDARAALPELSGLRDPSIEIRENVPTLDAYWREASLLLYAPERGSGMKVKVLEALARGVPVLTNLAGAEGLPAALATEGMALAEKDADLVESAVRLLTDRALQTRQREAGRRLVVGACDPRPAVTAMLAWYENLIRGES